MTADFPLDEIPAIAGRRVAFAHYILIMMVLVDTEAILRAIDAPPRLIKHGELVGEAAEEILAVMTTLVPIDALDAERVRLGARLHDAGKARHPTELDAKGNLHEAVGETLLLAQGVDPRVARMCRSHAQWREMSDVTMEDLLVALADSLWKGKRVRDLEERVIDTCTTMQANSPAKDRWNVFTLLDDAFERIASGAQARLDRSR